MIKSISYDQSEIIKWILQLHVPTGKIDCDPTYSIGNFYKDTGIEEPLYKFDINPQVDGVEYGDSRKLPLLVYRHDINKREIVEFNIFDHWRFEEDVKKDLKKCKTKEEFAEKLKSNLMYYFWSKCEYEVIISSFPVHIKKEEFDRLTDEFKKDTEKYGHEPYGMWVRPDVGSKIDICGQVMLNFEVFVDYVWSHKRSKK